MGTVLDLNFQDVDDIKTLGADTEIKLRVDSFDIIPRKKNPSIMQAKIKFVDPTDPLVDDIYEYMRIPTEDYHLEEPKAYAKLVKSGGKSWKAFYGCFGIDTSGPVDIDNIVGAEGWCLIGLDKDQNGNDTNEINKFLVGK